MVLSGNLTAVVSVLNTLIMPWLYGVPKELLVTENKKFDQIRWFCVVEFSPGLISLTVILIID